MKYSTPSAHNLSAISLHFLMILFRIIFDFCIFPQIPRSIRRSIPFLFRLFFFVGSFSSLHLSTFPTPICLFPYLLSFITFHPAYRSRICERTILLRFLGIILRFRYTMFTLQTSNHFCSWGGGGEGKSLSRGDCE